MLREDRADAGRKYLQVIGVAKQQNLEMNLMSRG